jgi:hypothetical protein
MEYTHVIIICSLFTLIAWPIYSGRKKAKRLNEWRENCKLEARAFLNKVQSENFLPTADSSFMLKSGEVAYFCDDVDLYETRSVRSSTATYTGVRIMKGIYIGGSQGTSSSTERWTCVASGKLVITNQRLIFDGDKNDRNIPLNRIFNAESSQDGVSVSCEGRQKTMIFACKNPLILAVVIRICTQSPNPSDLNGIKLDIQFV